MLREDTSLLDVVILVVFAQGMGIWWGAETPFACAKDYEPADLLRFEAVSSGGTIAVGLVASMLTKRLLPVIVSIVLCLVFTWFYDWEYAKKNPHKVAHDGE